MDNSILSAIIGVIGVIIGVLLKKIIPDNFFHYQSKKKSLVGKWDSSWGPLPNGPTKHKAILDITNHSDGKLKGIITREVEPDKKWEIEGILKEEFLMLFYFPAKDSDNKDFIDIGVFFSQRQADGTYVGYSTGYGISDDNKIQDVTTDYHVLKRIK